MPILDVNGSGFYYHVDDFSDPWLPSETVLLHHSAGGNLHRWRAWVPTLARFGTVVRFDMRGHAGTPPLPHLRFSLPDLAADIARVMDGLEIEKVHLVGASAGGIVSLRFAHDFPDRLLGLKAEHFLSPEKGRRAGAVEIDGEWFYHNGNMPLTREVVPDVCLFFQTLEAVEAHEYDYSCWEQSLQAVDREVLTVFFNATNGPNWKNNANWLSDRPLNEWFGVSGTAEHVTILRLDGNQLKGVIPPEIGSLEYLLFLYLTDNHLTGEIPPQMGNLARLRILHLSQDELRGRVPAELGHLAAMQSLRFRNNQLTGGIPDELSNLMILRSPELGYNQMRGNIPAWLGNLPRLEYLDIDGNRFTGCIPAVLESRRGERVLPPKLPYCDR